MAEHDYLKVGQAAEMLQVCTRTIFRYINQHRLEATQLCPHGPWRINRKSVETLLTGRGK